MKLNICRATGTILLFLSAFSVAAEGLMVENPWVRSAPPNAPALAAFMMLKNHGDTELSVVEVRTTLEVKRVELHRTMMADGVMKMMPQESIPVAAHSSTELKPGSWHIMLIGPQRVPNMGEMVELILILSDGSEQVVMAIVRQGKKMMEGHKHEMKME